MDQDLTIDAGERAGTVSGILRRPDEARWLYVVAHGAGAGMRHPFLDQLASALASVRIGTLRYQFPYMEKGKGRPDVPAVAHAAVRAAVRSAREVAPDLRLIAGGKSFGGRMTSQAQAEDGLAGVRGLAFLGFPLHAPGKPDTSRGDHLMQVELPMLFLQGTRDEFADLTLLGSVCGKLGAKATLHLIEGGDHSFKKKGGSRGRGGSGGAEVVAELARAIAEWTLRL